MRFVILLVFLAIVAAVVVMLYYSFTSPPKKARWEVHTEAKDGRTVVAVRQVRANGAEQGRQQVAEIPDGAADWDARYHEAMAEARARLAAIESQQDD